MQRTSKFYFKNEKQVMKQLGLKSVPGSGSGWIHKEDGESETLLVQLKSTDAESYRICLRDVKKLEYHAQVANKVPVFLIQFLQNNKIYALVDISDVDELYNAMVNNEKPKEVVKQTVETIKKDSIKSSNKSRTAFYKEQEEKYGKRKR